MNMLVYKAINDCQKYCSYFDTFKRSLDTSIKLYIKTTKTHSFCQILQALEHGSTSISLFIRLYNVQWTTVSGTCSPVVANAHHCTSVILTQYILM